MPGTDKNSNEFGHVMLEGDNKKYLTLLVDDLQIIFICNSLIIMNTSI